MNGPLTDLMPVCAAVERPQRLFDPATTVHGLRVARAAIVGAQRVVDVWLYQDPPTALADPSHWTLLPPPGAAIVDITAAVFDGDHVRLTLLGMPDPTRYRLELTPPAGLDFDPLRLRLPVRLRPECPDLGNCFESASPALVRARSPVHDYTARDWRALQQALLEFHLRQRPDADTSLADPTVAVIELFAHLGDVLHYRLDRVATESYLATARWRTSVRRHAQLLDYQVADAVASRAAIHVSVPPGGGSVAVFARDQALPDGEQQLAFTLEHDLTAVDALGEIAIYDWGEVGCCLPVGATSAVLVRPIPADPVGTGWLAAGDRIVFEIVDPGDEVAHDRWRRRNPAVPWPQVAGSDAFRSPLRSRLAQVVELTSVDAIVDPLAPSLPLARVSWGIRDALASPFPVSIDIQRGAPEVTIARGNLVDAHHGVLVDGASGETLEQVEPDWMARLPLDERVDPNRGWLLIGAPAGLARRADGSPYRLEIVVNLPSGGRTTAAPVMSHLGVTGGQLAVTVDEEEWRAPLVRFRTGAAGIEPPDGSVITAVYEAGGGGAGNVPANTLTHLERNAASSGQRPQWQPIANVSARNPAPAGGGIDAEALNHARRAAPQAFTAFPRRAVLPADHATAARGLDGVDRASATRSWTGAWPLIATVVDLVGTDTAADLEHVTAHLDGLRMLGQEVSVVPGTGVGLVVGLDVCVVPGLDTEAVRREILARLRPGTDAAPGVFHPRFLRLGGTIHTSAIVAAVADIHGVDAVGITTARRLTEPPGTVHVVLTFDQSEIPVLDDDPARPERGRLEITMRGGR